MAYYSYNNQGDFNGDYHHYDHSLNSNYSTYNYNYPVPVQHSSYNNSSIDYQIHGYDSTPSSISYSVSTPNYIQYEYPPANSDSSAQPQFIISHSVSHFNDGDDEFDEYDPTPYDGGYDLALTYGNPLPPSVETCYPRSASSSSSSASAPISVPPAPISTPAAKTEAKIASGGQTDVVREEESESTASGRHNDVVEEEEESNFGGGSGGGEVVSYGDEKRVGEMPYGYGLEAMDICEGLFGYWPCVDRSRRIIKEDCEKDEDCENCRNENSPWDVTSDYLFGNPNPYAQTRGFVDHNNYGPQNYLG